MLPPWEKVESEVQGDYTVFRVRRDQCRSPLTGRTHPFYVIESNDWVNVIPITPEGRLVCVEQYRHGTDEVTLEVPGGVIDAEDASPAAAARREMVEETGYDTGVLVSLGAVAPNPAIQNNRCHSFLALDARPCRPQHLDATEHLVVRLVDPAEVPALVAAGRISHALVVVAFYLYDQYRKAHGQLT